MVSGPYNVYSDLYNYYLETGILSQLSGKVNKVETVKSDSVRNQTSLFDSLT